jgi:S1-C subfamily serine protease
MGVMILTRQKSGKFLLVLLLGGVLFFFYRDCIPLKADTPQTYDAESVYELAQNSVFYIRAIREDGSLKDVGTGFLISQEGTALTAYHVIEGVKRLSCVLQDGTEVNDCTVIAVDETTDAAVLHVPPISGYPQYEEGYPHLAVRTSEVRHGERVFAIGYPMKETQIITEGVVNTPHATINGRDRILVSAQVVSGMSGGPILDRFGNVAGVISGSLRTMNNIHLVVNMKDVNKVLTDHQYQVAGGQEE